MFKENDLVFIDELLAFGKVQEVKDGNFRVEFSTGSGGGCLFFEESELSPVWCIMTNYWGKNSDHEPMYLAWQNPAWDDDGYFWTSKETMEEIYYNNCSWHLFLFSSRENAIKHLKKIKISQRCSIVTCN